MKGTSRQGRRGRRGTGCTAYPKTEHWAHVPSKNRSSPTSMFSRDSPRARATQKCAGGKRCLGGFYYYYYYNEGDVIAIALPSGDPDTTLPMYTVKIVEVAVPKPAAKAAAPKPAAKAAARGETAGGRCPCGPRRRPWAPGRGRRSGGRACLHPSPRRRC